jgi:hypothetical protein
MVAGLSGLVKFIIALYSAGQLLAKIDVHRLLADPACVFGKHA